jgi:hypothetical protein
MPHKDPDEGLLVVQQRFDDPPNQWVNVSSKFKLFLLYSSYL